MKTAKLGAIFLIAIMALAGVGAGYAAWTDTITIEGTVNTGSVDLVVAGYSGTWVWKDLVTDEMHITTTDEPPDENDHLLVASAWAEQAVDEGDPIDDAVTITFKDLFPCITFEADILFHYVGSVPVRISNTIIDFHEGTSDVEMLALWQLGLDTKGDPEGRTGAWIDWYWSNEDGDRVTLIPDYPIGLQLHNCNYIMAVGGIHLPQEDNLMGKSSSFTATFDVIQWNEYIAP